MLQRWALVRERKVRGYLDHPPVITDADEDLLTDAKRQLVFGSDDDGERALEPEGDWVLVPPEAGLVGDDCRYEDGVFLPRLIA